jgi:hypothetical protein
MQIQLGDSTLGGSTHKREKTARKPIFGPVLGAFPANLYLSIAMLKKTDFRKV